MLENDDSSLTAEATTAEPTTAEATTAEPTTAEPTTEDSNQSLSLPAEVSQQQRTGQEPVKSSVSNGYDPEWYKKDDRWVKRGMWKSEQDIIKSYYEADKILETKYKPIAKQYDCLLYTSDAADE